MDTSNLAKLIVAAIIGLVLVTAILIPTIDSGKIKNTVEQEDGSFRYYATDEIGVGTYTVDSDTLKLNDETVGTKPANIISDKFRVIFYNGTLTLYDITSGVNSVSLKSITFAEDGSYTYTNTSDVETTASDKISWFMGVAPTGNYAFGIATYSLKVNETSEIYLTTTTPLSDGSSSYDPGKYIFNAKGTINDLDAICYVWSAGAWTEKPADATITNTTNVSEGVIGVSNNSQPVLTVVDQDNSTAMLIFVPYEYKVVSDDPINDMLTVLPVIAIAGIVVAIVGAALVRRD